MRAKTPDPVPRNRIRQAIRSGRKAHGYCLTFPSPEIIEILGQLDFDFVWIEGEHGGLDLAQVESLCRVAERVGVTPITRVPNVPGIITSYLDRGSQGIVAPHVDTVEDAMRIVHAARFGPDGDRSYGAPRPDGFGYGVDAAGLVKHLEAKTAETIVAIVIESAEAVANLDRMMDLPGIDFFLFGQIDLAQSLGHPGEPSHPEVVKVVADVRHRMRARGRLMRRDFMVFSFVQDILLEGGLALRDAGMVGKLGRVLDPSRALNALR